MGVYHGIPPKSYFNYRKLFKDAEQWMEGAGICLDKTIFLLLNLVFFGGKYRLTQNTGEGWLNGVSLKVETRESGEG